LQEQADGNNSKLVVPEVEKGVKRKINAGLMISGSQPLKDVSSQKINRVS